MTLRDQHIIRKHMQSHTSYIYECINIHLSTHNSSTVEVSHISKHVQCTYIQTYEVSSSVVSRLNSYVVKQVNTFNLYFNAGMTSHMGISV